MVELQLSTSDWQAYQKDHYISVRVGEVQKLAKLSASRSYKFPAAAVSARKYGKVEIFRRIGTAIICVDPELAKGRNEVEVDLGTGSKISFEAEVSEPGGQAARVAQQAKAAPSSPSAVSNKAAAYLEQHHLEVRLSDAMQAVLRERPEDPATFLANMLLKNANVVAKLPKAPRAEAAGKAPVGNQAAQGLPAEPGKPRPADVKAFGSYYVQNFQGGQMPGLYAKFPAAPRPPPMPTTGEQRAPAFLPSSGSFGGCTARHGGTIQFKVRAVASAAEVAPADEESAPALVDDTLDTGFMMMNVAALGPGFWSTGMAPGLMF